MFLEESAVTKKYQDILMRVIGFNASGIVLSMLRENVFDNIIPLVRCRKG